MNCFPYKETHFFDFIQFPSCIAQLCNLVAHPVGPGSEEQAWVESLWPVRAIFHVVGTGGQVCQGATKWQASPDGLVVV